MRWLVCKRELDTSPRKSSQIDAIEGKVCLHVWRKRKHKDVHTYEMRTIKAVCAGAVIYPIIMAVWEWSLFTIRAGLDTFWWVSADRKHFYFLCGSQVRHRCRKKKYIFSFSCACAYLTVCTYLVFAYAYTCITGVNETEWTKLWYWEERQHKPNLKHKRSVTRTKPPRERCTLPNDVMPRKQLVPFFQSTFMALMVSSDGWAVWAEKTKLEGQEGYQTWQAQASAVCLKSLMNAAPPQAPDAEPAWYKRHSTCSLCAVKKKGLLEGVKLPWHDSFVDKIMFPHQGRFHTRDV